MDQKIKHGIFGAFIKVQMRQSERDEDAEQKSQIQVKGL